MVKSDKPHTSPPPLPHTHTHTHTHTNGIGLQSGRPSEDAINGYYHRLRTGSFHLLLNGCYLLQVWERREGKGGGKEREEGRRGEGGMRNGKKGERKMMVEGEEGKMGQEANRRSEGVRG